MPILADFHMHTHHSGDSQAPMEDMVKRAIEKGLTQICFTEHQDLDYPELPGNPKDLFTLDTDPYRDEVLSMKEKYSGKIDIGFGVELGLQLEDTLRKNREYMSKYDFDFVIGSIHLLDREDFYYESVWEGRSISDMYRRCFESTLENITEFTDFDVLGHLDYITRYAPDKGASYRPEDYADIIDAILLKLIKDGKGLDVNSKVLFTNPEGNPNPHPYILKRFNELGGRIITFGSDAHFADQVACGFERTRQMALDAGFTEYYTFKGRKPSAHKL
ncbi:histidinol-phosphatase HisJ family protein [Butyrivibrio sp. FCS014]|uniref:histidinol-phosphatase HisJ family protein n=1 Tax=Butyrivibrio sp. FCS014 TaxID=1408304 RepID=UPI000467DE0C|nr:histidinol-phosphatase HisJ family protein [Butyrivibrio sp. FCS014]